MTERATRRALETTLDDFAAQLEDVTAANDGPVRTWRRGATAFAALESGGANLRVGPRVASAALATPDTDPSPRGPDWVTFHPPELDEHALDRLEAWFELAWRRAAN